MGEGRISNGKDKEAGNGRRKARKRNVVIPSGGPQARRRGIAIIPVEGQAPRSGRVRFLASAAARLRSE